jgi:hypothetical protein
MILIRFLSLAPSCIVRNAVHFSRNFPFILPQYRRLRVARNAIDCISDSLILSQDILSLERRLQIWCQIAIVGVTLRQSIAVKLCPHVLLVGIFDLKVLTSDVFEHFSEVVHAAWINCGDSSPIPISGTSFLVPAATARIIPRCPLHDLLNVYIPLSCHLFLNGD